jgi:hypothetical protein
VFRRLLLEVRVGELFRLRRTGTRYVIKPLEFLHHVCFSLHFLDLAGEVSLY